MKHSSCNEKKMYLKTGFTAFLHWLQYVWQIKKNRCGYCGMTANCNEKTFHQRPKLTAKKKLKWQINVKQFK